jgi:hypothetical protein
MTEGRVLTKFGCTMLELMARRGYPHGEPKPTTLGGWMANEHAWTCDSCGYGEPAVEGDRLATLRRWAAHVGDVHGDDVLEETLRELVHERVEELRHDGTILRDPFTGRDYWMGEP